MHNNHYSRKAWAAEGISAEGKLFGFFVSSTPKVQREDFIYWSIAECCSFIGCNPSEIPELAAEAQSHGIIDGWDIINDISIICTYDYNLSRRPNQRPNWVNTTPITGKTRDDIFKRDGYICSYCGTTDDIFQIDHIIPRSKGGTNARTNLCVCCVSCNTSKGNKGAWEWMKEKGFSA